MNYRQYHTTLEPMQRCIVVFAFCTLTFAAGDLEKVEVCRFGWRADKGTCQKCRCYGGEEFNETSKAQLQQSETAGFQECPPCVPCPSGKFRIPDSPSMWCTRCRLDCALGNKHWKVPCGNITPGECGNCFNGFEPLSADPNSPCVKKKLDENPSTTVTPDRKEKDSSVGKTFGTAIGGALLVALIVVIVIYIRRKKSVKETSILPTKSSGSMRCILSSNTTCNNDLNVDGPLDELVRGELPSILTSRELDVLLPVADPNYPTMKFTERHCHELGKLISGDEHVMTFFRELGMNETFYNPYRDKFYREKILFQDCVFGSLKDWLRANPNVTVDRVCQALKSTYFDSIIPEFLDKITTCKDIT